MNLRAHGRGLDGRTVGRAQTGCGCQQRERGRGLRAYLQHDLAVMTGRLSASIPTTRRSSSRLGSGLLITAVVVQGGRETDRQAGMQADGPNRAILTDKRSRLLPDNAEKLLIMKQNLLKF